MKQRRKRGNGFSMQTVKGNQPHDPNRTSKVAPVRSRTHLIAADLVRPDQAPEGVQGEIRNFMLIANHRGIKHIPTLDIAVYCLKGMWDFAKIKIREYDEARKPELLKSLLNRYAA